MNITKEYLESINPDGLAKFSSTPMSYPERMNNLGVLAESLISNNIECTIDRGIQDAYFYAALDIGDIGDGRHAAIRFSIYENLTCITLEEELVEEKISVVVDLLVKYGYTYVPWKFFGESFWSRDRVNGDLFNRLFDYE